MTNIRKTYFVTDQLENKFPIEFVNSTNKRYIEVFPPYISNTKVAKDFPKGVYIHTDFIERDFYMDHAICLCNSNRTKYKKYEIRGNKDTFKIWFTDLAPLDQTVEYVLEFEPISLSKYMYIYGENDAAIAYMQQRYPGHDQQIEELVNLLLKYKGNISKIRADPYWTNNNLPVFDTIFTDNISNFADMNDLIEYIANLYGKKEPDEVYKYNITQDTDILGNLVYTETYLINNYDINLRYSKTVTTTYQTYDKIPFIAEFLLIY